MPKLQIDKNKFITFGKPDIGEEEMSMVMDVMRSGWLGTGKVTKQFESEFIKFMGGGYAVAVSSATIGLVISLKALGIYPGAGVLTSPLTFCATVNAIIQAGGRPIFNDVDENGLLSEFKGSYLQRGVHHNVSFVLPVNYCGLRSKIKTHHPIIEDAAHSFGGSCGYGDATVFSLYATKNITSGEGGIVWTRSKELADKCRILSNHGQSNGAWSRYSSGPIDNYRVMHPGFKGNLPDILAAIGLTQLRRWPELREKRDKIWSIYEHAFGRKEPGHSQHLYTLRVKNRHQFREVLYNKGIGTGIHYEALHLEPAYAYLGYRRGDFPNAEKIGSETVSLPVSSSMTPEDAHYVVKTVKGVINGRA